ncbi:hypothetical protein BH24DEI2_BH24DEI2_07680 [soil metagenome]
MEAFVPTRSPDPLPGTRLLALEADSTFEMVEQLEQGLSPNSVERLARHLDVPLTQMLELADLKSSTFFETKKRRGRLNPEASGRVYRLAKVVEAADDFFEDQAAARRWLSQPKVALDGKVPLSFARSAEGADYVVKMLGRMAHGVVS